MAKEERPFCQFMHPHPVTMLMPAPQGATMIRGTRPFCARCKEEFPVAKEPATWRMGFLRPLSKLPRRLREHPEIAHHAGGYLCGNCYFDLTDEE